MCAVAVRAPVPWVFSVVQVQLGIAEACEAVVAGLTGGHGRRSDVSYAHHP